MQNQYHQTLLEIVNCALDEIKEIDAEQMNYKQSATTWSKKELLGHLIDSAYNNYQRIIRAESQGNLIFQGYDQDAWVLKNNYQNRELGEVISLWELANRHIAFMLKSIPIEVLDKKTTAHNFDQIGMSPVEKGALSSLSYFIWDYLFHLEYHLNQIIPNYKKLNPDFQTNS